MKKYRFLFVLVLFISFSANPAMAKEWFACVKDGKAVGGVQASFASAAEKKCNETKSECGGQCVAMDKNRFMAIKESSNAQPPACLQAFPDWKHHHACPRGEASKECAFGTSGDNFMIWKTISAKSGDCYCSFHETFFAMWHGFVCDWTLCDHNPSKFCGTFK